MDASLIDRKRKRLRAAALATALLACVPLGHAGYMGAKAGLAQVLLLRAWNRSHESGVAAKPWPWADTAPVARLRVARLAVDEIVLRGDSGPTLAFGPGWAESSALPGGPGLSMVSAHRDTHFAFLRDLATGDAIRIDSAAGSRTYTVRSMHVADSRSERVDTSISTDALLLVTCYPFDAIDAGGPLRFVVAAVPGGENSDQSSDGSPPVSAPASGLRLRMR